MSLKGIRCYLFFALLQCSGCVFSNDQNTHLFELDEDTKKLVGWFFTKGEWLLMQQETMDGYDPYTSDEKMKCVSLINATGLSRSNFNKYDKERIIVLGRAIKYDELDDGKSETDILLSKKYFKNELVENYCLRDFVFVVDEIMPLRILE